MRVLFMILLLIALMVTEIDARGDIAITKFNPKLSARQILKRERKRARAKARRLRKRAARKRRKRLNSVFVVRGDFSRE